MAKKITATEAAKHFREVLNEVELKGEVFAVERHGKLIAEIRPASPQVRRGVPLGDVLRLLQDAPQPDADWERDYEEMRRSIGPMPGDPWERS